MSEETLNRARVVRVADGRAAVRSLWLQEALGRPGEEDAAPLIGELRADVCIVGGGYAGLWAALHLKDQAPALGVVLIERDVCGGGASGRNAGYLMSYWTKFLSLEKACGTVEALRIGHASDAAGIDIRDFCREHAIDIDYRQDGWLWAATNPAQIDAWQDTIAALDAHGVAPFDRWSPADVTRRAGSARHLAGVCERAAARIQPALLARGLRRVALARGVRIFEHTPLQRLQRGTPARIVTPRGSVRADRVLIAMGAWGIRWPEIRQAMVVVTGDVVFTGPIPERLAALGWTDGLYVSDGRALLNYYRTTRDHRLLFGKGGMSGRFPFGGHLGELVDGASAFASELGDWLRWTYPTLADVPLAGSWRGPVDRTANGLPFIDRLRGHSNVYFAAGFSGLGIVPCRLAAHALADLALERRTERSGCGLVRPTRRDFPREPFRYLGSQIMRHALLAKDAAEDRGRTPNALLRAIVRYAPAGVSPFKAVSPPDARCVTR